MEQMSFTATSHIVPGLHRLPGHVLGAPTRYGMASCQFGMPDGKASDRQGCRSFVPNIGAGHDLWHYSAVPRPHIMGSMAAKGKGPGLNAGPPAAS